MNGRICGGWSVVPAGQGITVAEARKELRYYLDCILQFRKQLEALLRRQPELRIGTGADEVSDEDPRAAYIIVDELNNRYEIYIRLRDELEQVTGARRMAERAAALVAEMDAGRPNAVVSEQERRKAVAARVEKTLTAVDGRVSAAQQKEIEAAAQACLEAASANAADMLATDLNVRVSRFNREARENARRLAERRNHDAREARDMLHQLIALTAAEDGLLEDLRKASTADGPFGEDIRSRAEAALAAGRKRYAGKVLAEALRELGYDVQQEVESLFTESGSEYFQRESWGEYQCRVSVSEGRISFDMVRYGESDIEKDADREMEEEWHGEMPALLRHLAGKGLDITLTSQVAPGEIPLQIVDDARLKPAKRRKAQAQRQRALQI